MNVLLEHITAHKTNGVLIRLELLYVNVSVDMNHQMELVKVRTCIKIYVSSHPAAI